MKRAKLRWRRGTGGYHFYEDDKHGRGYVHKSHVFPAAQTSKLKGPKCWFACGPGRGSEAFSTLKAAKQFVEKACEKKRKTS